MSLLAGFPVERFEQLGRDAAFRARVDAAHRELRDYLGATRTWVLTMVLKQGLTLVAAGLVAGLAGAMAFSTMLSAYLYETPPRDPVVMLAVSVVFMAAGLLACLGPARRATFADPLVALRSE